MQKKYQNFQYLKKLLFKLMFIDDHKNSNILSEDDDFFHLLLHKKTENYFYCILIHLSREEINAVYLKTPDNPIDLRNKENITVKNNLTTGPFLTVFSRLKEKNQDEIIDLIEQYIIKNS